MIASDVEIEVPTSFFPGDLLRMRYIIPQSITKFSIQEHVENNSSIGFVGPNDTCLVIMTLTSRMTREALVVWQGHLGWIETWCYGLAVKR